MCLLAIVFQQSAECPLLVLANREEARSRPSLPPQIHPDDAGRPSWLGGTDNLAGGTWLGLNRHGLIAAVTNRPTTQFNPQARSRGLLCRDLLACQTAQEATDVALAELASRQYNGCNLIVLTRDEAFVVEAADSLSSVPLAAGVHVITNRTLNDPEDRRITRVRDELNRLLDDPIECNTWPAHGQRICGLLEVGNQPPVCYAGGERGTVSSTVLALPANIDNVRFHFSPGPPSETAYDDYSPLARELLAAGDDAGNS